MPAARYRLEDVPAALRARLVVDPAWGCWEWQHNEGPDSWRYGLAHWEGEAWPVHRLFHALMIGPIPEGWEVDHVYALGCRSKSCCWPAHLEAVPKGENSRRGIYANTTRGVVPAIQKRLALGVPRPADLPYADAIWMLPLPVGPERPRRPGTRPVVRACEPPVAEGDHAYGEVIAAAMLAVERKVLQRWRRRGDGPEYVQAGQRVYYTHSALTAYVEKLMREQHPAA
jgi:HNH endonuclease